MPCFDEMELAREKSFRAEKNNTAPGWRNWYTHILEVDAGVIPWRFESSPGHTAFSVSSKTEVPHFAEAPIAHREKKKHGSSPRFFFYVSYSSKYIVLFLTSSLLFKQVRSSRFSNMLPFLRMCLA